MPRERNASLTHKRVFPLILFIYLSIYLSVYLSVYLSIYLSIYLSVYLSILQSMEATTEIPNWSKCREKVTMGHTVQAGTSTV